MNDTDQDLPPHGPPHYLWLDLETTGLDPEKNVILEVAVLATDEHLHQVSAACSWVVWFGQTGVLDMDDFVREMHTKNGLLAELPKAMLQLPAIESCLMAFVREVFGESREDQVAPGVPLASKPILAGSSIHFDRSFIKKHMPHFDGMLHYRHFDVSTLKMAAKTLYGLTTPKAEAHRALADVQESLAHARLCYGVQMGSDAWGRDVVNETAWGRNV